MALTKDQLPKHLQKYIVTQDYSRYTPRDQAAWRFCLRQLKNYLSLYAHECYLDGLSKTGINTEAIPKISDISEKIEKFGWVAMPVSGFIPPAAFMELQSLSVLPIASDMRSVDHLAYTPAPDIVHEAAGHAPILVDPEYAAYLKQYSQVAKKAIISQEDLNIYEAIRILSDIKENPRSTTAEIQKAESHLAEQIKNITHISEATQLSRMNWWTAEYGLIGDLNQPKIFGAGLLSSVGESKWCLSDQVKKIPLSISCVDQTYDITEPQPQLFVTPDFKTLVKVLNEFSETMAYRRGGKAGLDKAKLAKSVNTVQFDSGLQISGVVEGCFDENNKIIFIKLSGPSQICWKDQEISGHSKAYHKHGYSTPLGPFTMTENPIGQQVTLNYKSGFKVTGVLKSKKTLSDKAHIYTLSNATATYNDQVLFHPEWGDYDVITGDDIVSVYGGPADRISYGDTGDFAAIQVPKPKYSENEIQLFELYQDIRDLRQNEVSTESDLNALVMKLKTQFSNEWLLFLECYELAENKGFQNLKDILTLDLQKLTHQFPSVKSLILDGMSLAKKK